jgi:heme A synthase
MGNSPVDVQFGHRLVVLVALAVLTWYAVRLTRVAKKFAGGRNLTTMVHAGLAFFLLNIAVGGLYIVLAARDSGFPEHLSLLHLIFGTLSFLAYALAWLVCKLDASQQAD